ncbi:SDR family NAD(P)-dependent oxidoreductase [Agromyces sp. MMS24-K17]|uniref:SDR family NAD(P)-dependent oxidoreductase n=1 Tax=Agromyces sp. MMS24-K17 TaxID=3372850 RepID=UPI003754167B
MPDAARPPLAGRTVLIAGATSASGRAVAAGLLGVGARVVAVGSDHDRIRSLEEEVPGVVGEVADLTDEDEVLELAMRVHSRVGEVDGVIHLVGGWRGGGSIVSQSDDDYRALERSFTSLRHVTLAFWGDLVDSEAGRLAIVSSTSVERPRAGGANYVSVKAASEAWMQAVADGFRTEARSAAAVTFRVRALAGLEDELAASVIALWGADAAPLNGIVHTLGEHPAPAPVVE